MSRILYSSLFYILLPLVVLRLLWRSLREPEYRATPLLRFGFVNKKVSPGPVIWVHAVSAGETIAVVPLVIRLLEKRYQVVMTNMTPTGRERCNALLGTRVENYYAPYDLPGAMKRFLSKIAPRVLVLVDTELWPNMIHYAHIRGTKVLSINSRLSERSAKSYRLAGKLSYQMLKKIDIVAAQTPAHGKRYINLGLEQSKLHIVGSIKFNSYQQSKVDERRNSLIEDFGPRRKVMASSTHPGEEELLMEAFRQLKVEWPDLMLVIAPRHISRVREVERIVKRKGMTVKRRSSAAVHDTVADVFILDTMGELSLFYSACEIAIVGGSFVPVGGHNFVEAVIADLPVIMGPHLDNVQELLVEFVREDAIIVVPNLDKLKETLRLLIADAHIRSSMANRARAIFARNQGALERVEKLVLAQVK